MTAQVNLADYYHWEESGRGIAIYMRAAMADSLQSAVLAKSSGQSATEVGGILLGRHNKAPGGAIYIEDFVPVACAHTHGPEYELDDAEIAGLEAALLRAALAACDTPAAAVIGYYRSHLRAGLSLAAADVKLIESYFQDPASVFLVLKTLGATKACTAGFFFWEDGRIQPDFSALEVALGGAPAAAEAAALEPATEGAEMTGIFQRTVLGKLRQLDDEDTIPEIPILKALPAQDSGKGHPIWRDFLLRAAIVSLAAVSVVLAVLTYLGTNRSARENTAVPAPEAGMLGLLVQRNLPDLMVTWNQRAPAIVQANHATLVIRDGNQQKILELDKTQLLTGSVLYTPSGDDIQFQLEVYRDKGAAVAQSVRLLLPPPAKSPRR